MEQEQQPDLVEQFFDFLSQIVMPDWVGLIALLPLLFLVLIALYAVHTAWQWRKAGRRNRSRVAPRRVSAPPPGVHMPGPSRWPFVLPIGAALLLFALVLPPRDEAGQLTGVFNLPLLIAGLLVTVVAIAGWLRDAMHEWRSTAVATESIAGALAPGTRPIGGLPAHAGGGVTAVAARHAAPAEPPPGVHMPGPSPWPFFAPLGMAMVLFGLILSIWLLLGGLVMSFIAVIGWLREANHEYRTTEEFGHAVPATRDPERAWPRRLVPVYISVAVLSLAMWLVVPMVGEWLGSMAAGDPGEGEGPAVPAVPEITARTVASFETDTLVVPCCREFELIFHNEQDGVPHDVAITDGPDLATVYFDGDDITGPETITYQVPALEEGDHYFLCTIHPNMNGTVQARPEP
jgi:hypothetical protein